MHSFSAFAAHLGHVLAHYGGWGLFLINVLDSSVLAFPLVNDLLLIHMAAREPGHAPLYAIYCTAGSIAGSFVIYYLGKGGGRIFKRNPEMREAGRARRWLQRNDFATVLVASLLPPPTPFKVVPIMAGAMGMKPARLLSALLLGRGVRFAVEAWVGMRYGVEAETFLRFHLAFLSILTAVSVVLLIVVYRYLQQTAPAQ
ncbi:MAG TPA: VTT domain-containing protein [Terriglobia bacterium]|nr:VTT domain-containing protein [Terriglobia bacterium]